MLLIFLNVIVGDMLVCDNVFFIISVFGDEMVIELVLGIVFVIVIDCNNDILSYIWI